VQGDGARLSSFRVAGVMRDLGSRPDGGQRDARRQRRAQVISTEVSMLRWSLAFLILALVAAFFGFGGVASTSAGIAVTLFYVFLAVFVITLIMGLLTGRKTIP
jgi:uncharacterized membrane protein YtjA (UPF0391 family)